MAHSNFDAATWDELLALLRKSRILGDCDQSKHAEELIGNSVETHWPDTDSCLLAR